LIEVVTSLGEDGRALSPWYYPAPEDYQAILEKHGLRVESIELIPRPTPLPNGMNGWLKTFAKPFLKPFKEEVHEQILKDAENLMLTTLCDKNGNWHADYVRLRVLARKC
ncbi:MAG: SAM-dependent methyltransferase, partial [Alphaproteobacteria bacterium CG11_big_fil_rev_8_21_14_0_20_39_49]